MQLTKTHKIIISILIVAALLGVYILFDRKSSDNLNLPIDQNATTTTEGQNTTIGTTNSSISGIEATGGYTIEQVSGNEGVGVPQPVPDLNRKVTTSQGAYVTAEAKAAATEKILSLQKALKNNTADIKSWINLGIYQKMAGDFDGAILSWKYAIRLSPTDYVPSANLADLYAYFIHDIDKAEVYYKEAIEKTPNQPLLYVQLAEFYRDVLKDLNKARAIVEQGLQKVPNDQNLLKLKASLNQ